MIPSLDSGMMYTIWDYFMQNSTVDDCNDIHSVILLFTGLA